MKTRVNCGQKPAMLLKRISILRLLTFSCATQAVVIDDRDWRQVRETTNIIYDQMSTVQEPMRVYSIRPGVTP